jgi:hypothetical protein
MILPLQQDRDPARWGNLRREPQQRSAMPESGPGNRGEVMIWT